MSNFIRARKSLAFSQLEMGSLMGIHPMTISKIERGISFPSHWYEAIAEKIIDIDDAHKKQAIEIFYKNGAINCFIFLMQKINL